MHLSYWLPSNVEAGEQVPVIAVISPYYSYGPQGSESSATNVVSPGRGEFIFDNYVPHGYALAQVAVFGTEESSGCFDYRGPARSWHPRGRGVAWPAGVVQRPRRSVREVLRRRHAMEAAARGSEYLKPSSFSRERPALHPLLYKNGSAEARSQSCT
ncbi:MAG: hypothetical protein CM15mP79_0260 [Methanobacteriota archaeon]|nr:MAG: hypothetical protein CM15mP79_0260 [Euryarchaeota archaeon]